MLVYNTRVKRAAADAAVCQRCPPWPPRRRPPIPPPGTASSRNRKARPRREPATAERSAGQRTSSTPPKNLPPRYGTCGRPVIREAPLRSEEPTSELQSLMRNSYAVFCLKKKKKHKIKNRIKHNIKVNQKQTDYDKKHDII